jgi:hypothetical protein
MSDKEITLDEVIAEMNRLSMLQPDNGGGMTKKEIMAKWNISTNKASKFVHDGIKAGTIRCGKIRRISVCGDGIQVAAYFPVGRAKKK